MKEVTPHETPQNTADRLLQNTKAYRRFIDRLTEHLSDGHRRSDKNRLFEDDKEDACKTLILAMDLEDIRIPIRFRAYSSKMNAASTGCTIWQIAWAAISTPFRYNTAAFGSPYRKMYIDAMYGCANPAKEALDEATRIWSLSSISCCVSIGSTVIPSPLIDPENIGKSTQGKVGWRIATDPERVAIELRRDARMLGLNYFRFNCPWIETSPSSEKIQIKTAEYLHGQKDGSIQNKLRVCGRLLLKGIEGRPVPPVRTNPFSRTNPGMVLAQEQEIENESSKQNWIENKIDKLRVEESGPLRHSSSVSQKFQDRESSTFKPPLNVSNSAQPDSTPMKRNFAVPFDAHQPVYSEKRYILPSPVADYTF